MDQDIGSTIRLLVVDPDDEKAEAILNVFRDAGHATRGQQIISADSLNDALSGRRTWDLALVSELPEGLTLAHLMETITHQDRDIPVIMLSDTENTAIAFEFSQMGGRAVVPEEANEYLLQVADKELKDLKIRRHYRKMSVALHESEKQRRLLLDDQQDAIVYVSEGTVRYTNPAFKQLIGVESNDSLIGQPFKNLVAQQEQEQVNEFLLSVEETGQSAAALQCPLVAKGSSELLVRAVISVTSFEGDYTLSILVRPDDGQSKKGQEPTQEVEHQKAPTAHEGLFDKNQLQERLELAVQRAVSGKEKTALMCITLDTLKAIHKKGGAQISQFMLMAVAKKLSASLGEKHRIASWGNGVFMALLRAEDTQQVQDIADKMVEQVVGDIVVGKHKLPVKLSLGGVLLGETGSDAKTLKVRARHAAGQALKEGGNQLAFYQKREVSSVSTTEKHLAGVLSQALKNDQMQLLYQPVVSLKGEPEEYYEVFLRMTDVEGKEHDGSSFRPKLDQSALWSKVDRWQLIQASKALMAKRKDGHDTRLIFHLGACTITDDSFVPWMGVALKAAGIPTSAVAMELSEPNLVRYRKEMPRFFKSIKQLGCQTAISDFGCSLNPMDNLQSLDIDLVRVDPSFTKDLTGSDKGCELQAVIGKLTQKNCKIIVPQVESAEEMAPLWHSGVDFIQGPFLQSPSEVMDFDFGSDI